jgi:Zn-dependent protease/CBS domain-containing protein
MAGRDTGDGRVPGVSLPLGRFGGIPVAAHWSALLGVTLLGQLLALTVLPVLAPGRPAVEYWLAGVAGAVALVGSLLAHELAHATVAARRGLRVRRITLWLLGGASELEHQPARPGDEVRIALAGPVLSLLLGGAFAGLAWAAMVVGVHPLITATLSWLGTVNIMLGAFNLFPGAPLDGGRILHGLIWWRSGDRERATRRATGSGQVLGALLAGIGVLLALNGRWDGLWLILLGWYLTGAAVVERAQAVAEHRLAGLRVADVMRAEPTLAPAWWTVSALAEMLESRPGAARQRVFPVVDVEGRAVGLVGLAELAAVQPAARAGTALQRVARPIPSGLVAGPADALTDVLTRPLVAGRTLLVVEQDGRVVGVVTAEDVVAAAELRALRIERPGVSS